jgi:hypothetical protein
MCQPVSPGSSGWGKRIGNVPRLERGIQRPAPTNWSNAACSTGVLAARRNSPSVQVRILTTGLVHVAESEGSKQAGALPQQRPAFGSELAGERTGEMNEAVRDKPVELFIREHLTRLLPLTGCCLLTWLGRQGIPETKNTGFVL